jgi:hypothetical protein
MISLVCGTRRAGRASVRNSLKLPRGLVIAHHPNQVNDAALTGHGAPDTEWIMTSTLTLVRAAAGRSYDIGKTIKASTELLGQRDDDALGAADVAEPIAVLVPRHLADEFGAVGAQAGDDVLNVVDGEHDATYA